MSLIGDFATMPLPDLLQWLAMSQKTGILLLQRARSSRKSTSAWGRSSPRRATTPGSTSASSSSPTARSPRRTSSRLPEAGRDRHQAGPPPRHGRAPRGGRGPALPPHQGRGDHLRPLPLGEGRLQVLQRCRGHRDPRPHRDGCHLHPHGGNPARRRVGPHPQRLPLGRGGPPHPLREPHPGHPPGPPLQPDDPAPGEPASASATSASCSTPPTSR